ncbi:MAG: hypothetical protein QF921_17600 [Pseudomonadales bacterium]|jgi:hypothetical protein|nr:hypothetical protein [Pseudomonadales bacterium]MDP6472872.1 hypothetical protein [Pseudomonadales bacterium]MDP6826372.1 hypothetical protein [Pseudomonadales bacterium]MDP6973302.1 hypothetical protein [Pseudomonadales bacterium]
MSRRRRLNVFSLSFLDVMSCGFGAVVLIFLIINHESEEDAKVVNKDLLSEVRMLDYQMQNGERDLFELKERLEDLLQRVADSDQKLISTSTEIEQTTEEFAHINELSLAKIKSLEELKSDVDSREEEVERLRKLKQASEGGKVRSFVGEGDRQYLTGLKVGGKNILIALDVSASMLDERIVNVLRRRNMSDARKRQAPKWQRAVRTVEWLAAQLPLDASFQLFAFDTEVRSLVPESDDQWIPIDEGRPLDDAIDAVRETIPAGGTSLENLFLALRRLTPLPDNVYLICDSLPTQGTRPPRKAMVSGRERLDLFSDAVGKLPAQVPINVIMFPMEGDPMASASYWQLARTSGGAFMVPARDWP